MRIPFLRLSIGGKIHPDAVRVILDGNPPMSITPTRVASRRGWMILFVRYSHPED